MRRKTLLASVLFLFIAAAMLARETPKGKSGSVAGASREQYFTNITLRTHENKEVRFYDDLLKGKIVLINFMYTNCQGI